jgi:hypothetical protein
VASTNRSSGGPRITSSSSWRSASAEPSSCVSSITSQIRSSSGASSFSSRSVIAHPSRSGAAVRSCTSADPGAVRRSAPTTAGQNSCGSRSPCPTGTQPAHSARPAAPIHDRSSTVFPLPGGADTTVTRADAPSRSNSPERDTTPPAPGRATASDLPAAPMTRSSHDAGDHAENARSGRSSPIRPRARPPPALMLIRDPPVRVIDAATGELIGELAIDPARNHQPTGRPPGPDQNRPDPISNPPDLLHAMHGGFVKTTIRPLTFLNSYEDPGAKTRAERPTGQLQGRRRSGARVMKGSPARDMCHFSGHCLDLLRKLSYCTNRTRDKS